LDLTKGKIQRGATLSRWGSLLEAGVYGGPLVFEYLLGMEACRGSEKDEKRGGWGGGKRDRVLIPVVVRQEKDAGGKNHENPGARKKCQIFSKLKSANALRGKPWSAG